MKIAETGSFRVVLEAGTKRELELIDADTTDDGVARLRLPAGTFETSLHLQGPWKTSSSLEIEDSLYYVKDVLNTKTGKPFDPNRWHRLGLRPLPVPQDWLSSDGQSFVIQIKVEDVKEFQLAWRREDGLVPFPPGINRVGSEGGIVDLPGVAKLELPSGAISQYTTVIIRQVLNAPPMDKSCSEYACSAFDYIGPVIKIEPLGLALNKPGALFIPSNLERLGNNNPAFVDYSYSPDLTMNSWKLDDSVLTYFPHIRPGSIPAIEWDSNPHRPTGIRWFGFYSKAFPAFVDSNGDTPPQYKGSNSFEVNSSFHIQQNSSAYKEPDFSLPFYVNGKETDFDPT